MKRSDSAYPLQPPRERGTGRAIALAILMHLLLGYFLYHGIQWQSSTPAGAEAELWTDVPDTTLPQPVPTPPVKVAPTPPVDNEEADIALQEKKRQQEAAREAQLAEQQRQKLQAQQEREAEAKRQQLAAQAAAELAQQQKAAEARLKQQQQQQAEKLKQQQLAEQQKQQQLEQQKEDQQKQAQADAKKKADADKAAKKAQADAQAKKLDQERRARLAQMQGLAGGEGSTGNGLAKSGTGSGSGGTAVSPGYADKVRRLVRPNIHWAGDTQGLETVVAVRCSPTGTLLSATVTRSSGNTQWDEAAQRAVQSVDPMPLDTNGKTPTSFTITLRPAG